MPDWFDWVAAGLLGALVGIGGIVSRYRDNPSSVLKTLAGIMYILLNLGVSVAALGLARAFGWTFGATEQAVRATQVLVAGIGGTVLIRASFFTVKVGDEEVQIGPNSLLQSIFSAIDRKLKQLEIVATSTYVSQIMADVSFEKAYVSLPTYCLALWRDIPDDVQKTLGEEVRTLAKLEVADPAKALILGAYLINVVGDEVLEAAVKTLDGHIKATPAGLAAPTEPR